MIIQTTPMRLRYSRRPGAKLVSPDYRDFVCCTRAGKWGNPYIVGKAIQTIPYSAVVEGDETRIIEKEIEFDAPLAAGECVKLYESWLLNSPFGLMRKRQAERDLIGLHLACYCKLCDAHANGKPLDVDCPDCKPCHVDVIGRILYPKRSESK